MGPSADITGLEQGGINSSDLYKLYNNEQLASAQATDLGVDIDSSIISAVGQADDVVLIANDLDSLDLLVKGTERYCNKYRVKLVPCKTKLLAFCKQSQLAAVDYDKKMTDISIDGQVIKFDDIAEHVGITRSPDGNMPHIQGRIAAHRRAMHSINRAGAARHHFGNPVASLRIHQLYGTSVLFSGMACLYLTAAEVKIIDQHLQWTVQNIQKLHQGTPRSITFLMAGCLPGEAILHLKQLTLFMMICHLPSDPLNNHAKYVLSNGQPPQKSWFNQILKLCEKYCLPHPHLLLEQPPPKSLFKKNVKNAVVKFWEDALRKEALELQSVKHFDVHSYGLSHPHWIWVTAGNNSFEVRKSCILARMISGRYRTDYFARHWSANKSGLCLIPGCEDRIGDLKHLLIECTPLSGTREKIINLILMKSSMLLPLQQFFMSLFQSSPELQCQFVLEPFSFHQLKFLCNLYGQTIFYSICYFVRTFAFMIHTARQKLMSS